METTRRGFFGRLAAAVGIVVGGTCLPEPRERLQFTTDTDHYSNQGWPCVIRDEGLYFRDDEIVITCEDSDRPPLRIQAGLPLSPHCPVAAGSNFTIEKCR